MSPHRRLVAADLGRLAAELSALRPPRGGDLLVHCSLRLVGRSADGPAALLDALCEVLGPQATLVVPTQTPMNSVTSAAFRRATAGLAPDQIARMEDRIEGFDPDATPSYGMGALAEHVRRQPGAVRSGHPVASFAAIGPRAKDLMAVHEIDCHLGDRSPVGALYRFGASVMLLGVGYEACTVLHLAEYRLPWPPPLRWYRCYTLEHGERVRHDFQAAYLEADDFGHLGESLDREPFVVSGPVGDAVARVMPVREAVDYAVSWLTSHRPPGGGDLGGTSDDGRGRER